MCLRHASNISSLQYCVRYSSTTVQGNLGNSKIQHSLRFDGHSYPLKSIQMTHLHFGVNLLFSPARDRWLQDATTDHGAPLPRDPLRTSFSKRTEKPLIHVLLLDVYQDGPSQLFLRCASGWWNPFGYPPGLCGVSTKTSNQTFNIGALNSSSRQKHYPPLKPTMPLSLKRAATNPYVALDQLCHNLILTVSPHDVLDGLTGRWATPRKP